MLIISKLIFMDRDDDVPTNKFELHEAKVQEKVFVNVLFTEENILKYFKFSGLRDLLNEHYYFYVMGPMRKHKLTATKYWSSDFPDVAALCSEKCIIIYPTYSDDDKTFSLPADRDFTPLSPSNTQKSLSAESERVISSSEYVGYMIMHFLEQRAATSGKSLDHNVEIVVFVQ